VASTDLRWKKAMGAVGRMSQKSNGLGTVGQKETGPDANKIKKKENKMGGLRWLLGRIQVGPQRKK
jgi:hypothetical protein